MKVLKRLDFKQMTRWARGKSNQPQYQDGSTWKELKQGTGNFPKTYKPINKEKRRENRRIKRIRRKESNKVCFHCRMPGHGMADCPVAKNDSEHVFNMCFKCGSTEHKSGVCTAKLTEGQEFAYAKCFVCGQLGHLSKSCPDNPRGLYPDGGSCALCGSVEHYRKHCPERKVKQKVTVYRIGKMSNRHSVDDEMSLYEETSSRKFVKPKPKVVKF